MSKIIKKEDAKYISLSEIRSTDETDLRVSVATTMTRTSLEGIEKTHNSFSKDQNEYGAFVRETKAKGHKLISKIVKSMLIEDAKKQYDSKHDMRLEWCSSLRKQGLTIVSGEGRSPHDKL